MTAALLPLIRKAVLEPPLRASGAPAQIDPDQWDKTLALEPGTAARLIAEIQEEAAIRNRPEREGD